jgi:hypothetical protein
MTGIIAMHHCALLAYLVDLNRKIAALAETAPLSDAVSMEGVATGLSLADSTGEILPDPVGTPNGESHYQNVLAANVVFHS